MGDYVNKISKNGATVELRDIRIPEVTADNVGKALVGDENGTLVFSDSAGGGGFTYGTEDMTPGVTELASGKLYFVYDAGD